MGYEDRVDIKKMPVACVFYSRPIHNYTKIYVFKKASEELINIIKSTNARLLTDVELTRA